MRGLIPSIGIMSCTALGVLRVLLFVPAIAPPLGGERAAEKGHKLLTWLASRHKMPVTLVLPRTGLKI